MLTQFSSCALFILCGLWFSLNLAKTWFECMKTKVGFLWCGTTDNLVCLNKWNQKQDLPNDSREDECQQVRAFYFFSLVSFISWVLLVRNLKDFGYFWNLDYVSWSELGCRINWLSSNTLRNFWDVIPIGRELRQSKVFMSWRKNRRKY